MHPAAFQILKIFWELYLWTPFAGAHPTPTFSRAHPALHAVRLSTGIPTVATLRNDRWGQGQGQGHSKVNHLSELLRQAKVLKYHLVLYFFFIFYKVAIIVLMCCREVHAWQHCWNSSRAVSSHLDPASLHIPLSCKCIIITSNVPAPWPHGREHSPLHNGLGITTAAAC